MSTSSLRASILVIVAALVAVLTPNISQAQSFNVCALPNSTGALGNLVIPSTVTEASTGMIFPTVAEICLRCVWDRKFCLV